METPPPPSPVPEIPPPPPPPPPAHADSARTATLKSIRSMGNPATGDLNEELKLVLPAITQRRNKLLDIKKTPDIFIDQKSNPDEVVEWLEAKGFSAPAQKALRMPGHQLFGLSRSQLEQTLGTEEGKRLYSQILVQRNVSGFKTTSASELQNFLRKAREKVEVS